MTQEEKDLLIQDLCGRLPYGVNIEIDVTLYKSEITNHRLERIDFNERTINGFYIDSTSIKPYLRPMSSMTEDERKEYYETMDEYTHRLYPNSADFSEHTEYSWTTETFDFLNANHLDYRGLIGKGLALPSPKRMYNIK